MRHFLAGDEIAIIGMMDGTAFVQVTDVVNPVVLGFLPQTGTTTVIWADMKVWRNSVRLIDVQGDLLKTDLGVR